jgi:hypothetical protein
MADLVGFENAVHPDLALSRCAFCHDQCMSASPEAVFSGNQRHVVSRVANRIRRLHAKQLAWSAEEASALYGGLTSGLQAQYCIYIDGSQRIEPYLYAARQEAVDHGVAPASVATYAENVASSGGELGANGPLVDSPALNAATGNGSSVRAGRSNPRLVGGQAARELDPDGWRAAWLLLGEGTAVVAVGSSGYLEYSLGLRELARRAARAAADAIEGAVGAGPLVTTDPALAFAARFFWPHLGVLAEYPVLTMVEYLDGRRSGTSAPAPVAPEGPGKAPKVVTYHDPGTLARGLGVTDAPRRLLVRAGATLVEPHTTGARAGDDGAYPGYPFPEIAARASAARAEELELTGAEVIVTASPWALANLRAATSLPVVDICTFVAGTGLAAEDGLAAEERPLGHG